MRRILCFGATSAIAEATLRRLANAETSFYLVGRNCGKLEAISQDLQIRGNCRVDFEAADLDDLSRHPELVANAAEALGGIDLVLIAQGTLPDQRLCEQEISAALAAIHTNAISVISLSSLIANHFTQAGSGTLVVIGSVAGDRGRQSNYVYGAAKAMVATFLQGLRNRLTPLNCHVITVKPGFVDSPMTAAFKKGPLWAFPDDIARGIVKAIARERDIVYLPSFWWAIMLAIKAIPESLFKKMRL